MDRVGRPGKHGLGVAILLFGAAGAFALLGWRMARPAPPPALERVLLPGGTQVDAVVLAYARPSPLVRAAVGLLAFAGCVILFLAPPPAHSTRDLTVLRLVLLAGILFFAVSVVLQIRARGKGGTFIALSADGLLVRVSGSSRFVDWRVVRDITKSKQVGTHSLLVAAGSAGGVVRDGGAEVLDNIGSMFYGRARVPVQINHLGLPENDVESLIRRFLEHARSSPGTLPDLKGLVADGSATRPT